MYWDSEWIIVKDATHGPFDWLSPGGIARRYLLFRPHTYNCRRVYMRHYSDPLTAARELVGKLSSTNYW